jgi:integrase
VGCTSSKKLHEHGPLRINDWRYWIPLIAIFTGARLGEISQLTVQDFKIANGINLMGIVAEDRDSRRVKTVASQRWIPVHSQLIDLGLLEFVAGAQRRSVERLFPEIIADTRGMISGVPSKVLNKYLTKIGVKTEKNLAFHSTRHTVADAIRRQGGGETDVAWVLGHAAGPGLRVSAGYGDATIRNYKLLQKIIEGIEYPSISFDQLRLPREMLNSA